MIVKDNVSFALIYIFCIIVPLDILFFSYCLQVRGHEMSLWWECYGKNSYTKLQLQDINDVYVLCILVEYSTKADTFCI